MSRTLLPQRKQSVSKSIPYLPPQQWYSSAKHLKIEAHKKRTSTYPFMQQEKIKLNTSNIKKKKRYRYILPCQVYFCPTVQSCRVKHYNISVLFFNLKTRFTEKCSAINIYTLKKRFLHDFSNIQLPISCATTTSPKRAGKDS